MCMQAGISSMLCVLQIDQVTGTRTQDKSPRQKRRFVCVPGGQKHYPWQVQCSRTDQWGGLPWYLQLCEFVSDLLLG